MTLATALALLVASASADPLVEARAAFASGDYPRAETLALRAAGVDRAPARYLAGLARFRQGRFAEALEALDTAEAGADSPAAWRFNRAACLSALSRHAEAEAAYLEAARDPTYAPLALTEAGWAALAAGASGRARDHAARARTVATGDAVALVTALEQELSAEADVPGSQALASAPAAPPARAVSWEAGVRLDGGWDGDALQTAFAAVAAWAAGRGALGGGTLEGGYAFGQLAYLATAAADRSVQTHDLALAYRASPRPGLQLEAGLAGQLALAGLQDLRGMQVAGGAWTGARLKAGSHAALLAELAWTAKHGLSDEFAYLGGSTLLAGLGAEGSWEAVTVRAGYRYQLEQIGQLTAPMPPALLMQRCPPGRTCTGGVEVQPVSFAGHAGWGWVQLRPASWLRFDLEGMLQRRDYLHDAYAELTILGLGAVVINPRSRDDWRWATGAAATATLAPGLSVTLRHAWQGGEYTLTPQGMRAGGGGMFGGMFGTAPEIGRWDKQVLQLGLTCAW
jgi:tetratricopeptide (TPR) repeat protein